MSGLVRRFYSPRVFDWMFGFVGVASIGALIPATGHNYPPVIASSDPLLKGGVLLIVLAIAALLAIAVTRFDQKKADDYLFITLTRSAYIGMATVLVTWGIWEMFLTPSLGGLTSQMMVGLFAASWSVGYFYTRLRGTGEGA